MSIEQRNRPVTVTEYATTDIVTAAYLKQLGMEPELRITRTPGSVEFAWDSLIVQPYIIELRNGSARVEPQGFHRSFIELRKSIDAFLAK
jgi:hypothetical protein